MILKSARGPEGPLFHGDVDINDFFRRLFSNTVDLPSHTSLVAGNRGGQNFLQ
jgi:hypothetical protein